MAGYSGTPLPKKLGIKTDHLVALIDAPPGFDLTLGELPVGVSAHDNLADGLAFDVIVFFTKSERDLQKKLKVLAKRLAPSGGLWIAWPKRASSVFTDLTENAVQGIGLEAGLVDNKVCAIDDTWSGLRFVIRLKDRPKK
ncbi:MAG: DUF3052 domain-containing protein [Gemmataceae bacterium]